MCTNNKIHVKTLCIAGEIYSDTVWIKFGGTMCQFSQISIICTSIYMKQLETDQLAI